MVKRVKSLINPSTQKNVSYNDPNFDNKKPLWSFGIMDQGGNWCIDNVDYDYLIKVIKRLSDLETMTWREIKNDPNNHYLKNTNSIVSKAFKRLEEIGCEDFIDQLFSIRIQGEPRIIGVIVEGIFKVIWWDAKHQVCPSKKKHT